jgi:hypothetical protein
MYFSPFNIGRIGRPRRRCPGISGTTAPTAVGHRSQFQNAGDPMNSDDAVSVFEETALSSANAEKQDPVTAVPNGTILPMR